MKIDKNKFPIIDRLYNNKTFGQIAVDPESYDYLFSKKEMLNKLYYSFVLLKPPVRYVSQAVMDVFDNDEKTAKKLWHLRGEVETCQGIYTNKLLVITIYSIKREQEGIAVSLMSFYKNMLTTVIDATYKYDFDEGRVYFDEENSFLPESIKEKAASLVELVVSFEIFRNMHWLKPNILHAKNRSRTKPSIVSIRTNLLSR